MKVHICQWTDESHWCDWEEKISVNQKEKELPCNKDQLLLEGFFAVGWLVGSKIRENKKSPNSWIFIYFGADLVWTLLICLYFIHNTS